ncbi:hypothetical protein [Flavobacterium sp. PS2]|jgi:hypothetical protein|uniref:hypothetical protein n=1 Tax=Flavobacterium sp. PS2 TaxID=3384157 RepID=UPI00390CABDF
MDILKLNRIICILFFVLLGCNTKENNNCNIYVGAGEGVLISFDNHSRKYSEKDLQSLKILINNKNIRYTKWEGGYHLYSNNYNISLSEKVLLKDTIIINIKSDIIKIYDFINITEEGFNESHNKILVCRYCKSTMNNQKMEDYGNNIIIVDFEKLKE